MKHPYGAGIDVCIADDGHGISLWGNGNAVPSTYNPSWQLSVWYHAVIECRHAQSLLTLVVSERDSGKGVTQENLPLESFPEDMTRLGVSRVHMKGGVPGASSQAATTYDIQNLHLYQIAQRTANR